MRRSLVIFASTVAAALLLAGCDHAADDSARNATTAGRPRPGPVDPEVYRSDGGYYFQSADRSITCGILDEAVGQPRRFTGCQGTTVPAPPEMQACWSTDPESAALAVGENAGYLCVNEGMFVRPDANAKAPKAGGPVLPAGSSLSVHGFTCQAQPVGIVCRNDANGSGFEIAPGSNRVF
ncbi:hypothetical protein [Nocardia sp. NPDC052566]|uniref:hypothetical protein n=1 Tax=Nocardia sp. NPDC052566 TaxID=3364330 RepID=UPI0037CA0798